MGKEPRRLFASFLCASTATGLALAVGEIAHAQTTAQPQAGSEVQELIVTARKRPETVQKVPGSMVALGQQQLQARGVVDLRDLSAAVPGINVSSVEPDNSVISIRGITTSSLFPTVGFYVDDVPLATALTGFSGQTEPPLFDTQRVEVLKGPQGTLYGGSSMGGAIKFVSNLPDPELLTESAGADVSSTNGGGLGYSGWGVVNIPLVDGKVAVRAGAYYRDDAGYIDRIADGVGQQLSSKTGVYVSKNATAQSDVNDYRTQAYRLAVGVTPDATESAVLSLYYQSLDAGDMSNFWPGLSGLKQSDVIDQPGSDHFFMPVLTLKKAFDGVEITSITGYFDRERQQTQDYTAFIDALVPPFSSLISQNFARTTAASFTQELRFASATPSSRLQYVGGLYFQRENVDINQNVYTYGSGATSKNLPTNDVFFGDTRNITTQIAAFGEATYAVTPQLDLTLGGRYFSLRQTLSRAADGLFNGGPSGDHVPIRGSGFSPKVEAAYKITDQNMVYALADKGFRPGGGNGPIPTSKCAADLAQLGLSEAPATFQSDSVWNYELGTKNTFMGGRVLVNAAAYYIDWSNIQQGVNLPSCGFGFTGNVGAAVSKGVEGEVRVSPLKGLTLDMAATYDNARITKGAFGVNAVVGDPVIGSPDFVSNFSAEYSFPITDKFSGLLRADYQFHGSQTQTFSRTVLSFVNPQTGQLLKPEQLVPNPAYLQKSFSMTDLNIGVQTGRWTARLFIDNAFNARPLLAVAAGSNETEASTLRPRTIGLGLTARF